MPNSNILQIGVNIFSGILQREDGLGPEDEENFEEALKAANTALEPTRYQRCKTLFRRLY
jgi:hypothetical protein